MSDKSSIEWCDATWNPVTGCTKVSEGCRRCYAATFAERWRGTPGHCFENGFDLQLRHQKLEIPFSWKKPKKVFVNSMSDLFHKDVPFDYIDKVFAVMALTPRHTYQILTKRPERMLEYFNRFNDTYRAARTIADAAYQIFKDDDAECRSYNIIQKQWPLPNVWLGTSVENQKAADERIPLLLQTPAAIRFLSCEPLLGPVNLNQIIAPHDPAGHHFSAIQETHDDCLYVGPSQVDWVIAGGESGHGARPMHPEWARSLRDQCQAAGVSYFFKQWGEWVPNAQDYDCAPEGFDFEKKHQMIGDVAMCKAGKHTAGRKIDGREWNEFPEVRS